MFRRINRPSFTRFVSQIHLPFCLHVCLHVLHDDEEHLSREIPDPRDPRLAPGLGRVPLVSGWREERSALGSSRAAIDKSAATTALQVLGAQNPPIPRAFPRRARGGTRATWHAPERARYREMLLALSLAARDDTRSRLNGESRRQRWQRRRRRCFFTLVMSRYTSAVTRNTTVSGDPDAFSEPLPANLSRESATSFLPLPSSRQ